MRKILLDTNAYGGLMRGDQEILDELGRADTVFMSVIVLGELHAGFRGGALERENRARLDEFLRCGTVRILPVTRETAEIFGAVKDRLRQAGTPLPINDVWIAAHAMESGARLVTRDAHFSSVAGLLLWKT